MFILVFSLISSFNINTNAAVYILPYWYADYEATSIIFKSEIILKVKVNFKVLDGLLFEQSTYDVTINEILKGNNYVGTDGTGYLVNVALNSLQEGNEYIMTLSRVSDNENGSIFTQSALNGIIPIENTETVSQIYMWINSGD